MNVFDNIKVADDEIFETIANSGDVRIERIISNGQTSPKGFFYDQDEYEFVILLKGEAELLFEDSGRIRLKEGDYLIIEPHRRHRVEYTSKPAIWLCVFYR
ncbi:cupin domain-containing protein [Hippea maritima]|uniref:Cupin 2 conserved barrel domain protein n=1 Tax=Hippea maritima (strain ATCC 700847 / DSM 10411 / MH2) TaxID=760142 RepID=F2LVK4_HIPMA|nr:Cupin 2 conserved barrel domain protein [Hippea maritima DSM 10411]